MQWQTESSCAVGGIDNILETRCRVISIAAKCHVRWFSHGPSYPKELAKPNVQNMIPAQPSAAPHAWAPPSGNSCWSCDFSMDLSGDISLTGLLVSTSGSSAMSVLCVTLLIQEEKNWYASKVRYRDGRLGSGSWMLSTWHTSCEG